MTLTGHSHDLYISFDGRALVAESSHDAHYVVVIDVDVEIRTENGRRKAVWWPNFRVIDTANVTPDLETLAVVSGFEQEFTREMGVALAKTNVEIDSRNSVVRSREAIIGNIIADAMRAQTDADVAVANGGGIRSGNVYPAGSEITRRDILAELPFDNRVVRLNVTGAELRAALENGFSGLPAPAGRFPAGVGAADRGRCVAPGRQPHCVDHGRRQAAGSREGLQRCDQRFHGARRRRLYAIQGCAATHSG